MPMRRYVHTFIGRSSVAVVATLLFVTPVAATWQWTAVQNVQDGALGMAAAVDTSGLLYLAGDTALTGNVDMLVMQFTSGGAVDWTATRGSAGLDSATGIALDSGGNVYVCGVCAAGFDSQAAYGSGDYVVVKYTSAGSWQWTRINGSPAYDAALALAVAADGVVYVVGTTEDRLGTSPRGGESDMFLAAHNPDGSLRWAVSRGSISDDWATAVLVDGDNVYVGGVTLGVLDGGPARGDMDGFVMCFDTNGTWQWTRQFGTNDNDIVAALCRGADGRTYAVGGTFGELSAPGRGRDVLLARLNAAGALEYLRAFGSPSNDLAVAAQAAGAYLNLAGYSYGTFFGASSSGGADLVTWQCTTNAVLEAAEMTGTPGDDLVAGGAVRYAIIGVVGGVPAASPGSFSVLAANYAIPEPVWGVVMLSLLMLRLRKRLQAWYVLMAGAVMLAGTASAFASGYENHSAVRGRMILNGVWQFKPVLNAAGQMTNGTWGRIWVPGSWRTRNNFAGVQTVGSGPAWAAFGTDGRTITACWYRTNVKLPPEWQGRGWSLELRRVGTDARVIVNGIDCGQVSWPFGTVEITHAVQRQPVADIRVLVRAENVVTTDTAFGFGLIGEVFLHSHPRGARVSDVFVKPSVRQWQLGLDVELSGLRSTGTVVLTPRVYNEAGVLEKTFDTVTLAVTGTPTVVVSTNWPWNNPRLWDLDQPNLYTLKLAVNGCGVNDEYPQQFGFREFWIEGRYFKLNGTPFRWRPTLPPGENYAYGNVFGVLEQIDGVLRSMRAAGYNCCEFWPDNEDVRGRIFFRDLWYERASQLGFPVLGSLPSGNPYFSTWSTSKEQYRQRLAMHIKRVRNYPAVILWVTSPNVGFNSEQDQNPRYLGRFSDLYTGTTLQNSGLEQIAMIKSYDPTRPATTHHGGCVGDVHTANHYLNLHPLQDRTEWLSSWATNADMPFCSIEFGTPFFCTVMRGRNGFNGARYTEPLLSEFCAIYLGRAAYALEQAGYRADIKTKFQGSQTYSDWNGDADIEGAPAFQALQALFNTHTFRSWRAWDFSGGLLPWIDGYGWNRGYDTSSTTNLAFYAGRRGAYLATVQQRTISPYQPPYVQIRASGYAIMTNNNDTLAWIAGPSNIFTDRSHSFRTNELVYKSLVIINDSRTNQLYNYTWSVTNNGVYVAGGTGSGSSGPGTTTFLPISFTTPASIPSQKTDGAIYLNATIGSAMHKDTFPFRVFAAW